MKRSKFRFVNDVNKQTNQVYVNKSAYKTKKSRENFKNQNTEESGKFANAITMERTSLSMQPENAVERCRSCKRKKKRRGGSRKYTGRSFNRTPYIDKYPHVCRRKKKSKRRKKKC